MKKRKKLATDPVVCSVAWCAALCAPETTTCAIHRVSKALHPVPLGDGEAFVYVPFVGNAARPPAASICSRCEGSGDCESCNGTGEHECGQIGCSDMHECGNCGGDGQCSHCDGVISADIDTPQTDWRKPKPQHLLAEVWEQDRDWANRYLRAVYLPVWHAQTGDEA